MGPFFQRVPGKQHPMERRMESESYQRARRRAALAGGGLLFAATLVAFLYQLPSTFFPHTAGPFWLHWLAFAVFYMAYATLSLPFDVWAGYWLPCRHQRSCRLLPVYLGALFRALRPGLGRIDPPAVVQVRKRRRRLEAPAGGEDRRHRLGIGPEVVVAEHGKVAQLRDRA